MTPVPFPYILSIEVYNEAGEKVKFIVQSPISGDVGDIAMLLNGITTTAFNPDTGKIELKFTGIQSPDQQGTGADHSISFFWDGASDSGQQLSPGLYYIKISTTDTYGHVNTRIESVQILKLEEYVRINIYNSAGELVRRLQSPDLTGASISLTMDDVVQVGKNSAPINIGYAAGSTISWDGLNSQGRTVDSGVYEIRVELKTGQSLSVMASKSVTVLNMGAGGIIADEKIYPNPVIVAGDTASPFVTIKWQTASAGPAKIQIYTITGELVKSIDTTIAAGMAGIQWNLKSASGDPAASGMYVVIIHLKKNSGESEVKKLKLAVVNLLIQ